MLSGSSPPAAGVGRAHGGRSAMDTRTQATPGRARCRVAPTALALLESARHGLANAADETSAGERYVAAHLAALRAAAAIVAARPAPGTGRRRKAPPSVWELLPRVEPALAEWAAFFAAGAGTRAAAGAGRPRAGSGRGGGGARRGAGTCPSVGAAALGGRAHPVPPPRC